MKALVKAQAQPGLWLQEQPLPQIGDDEVLIQIHKTAICGTDVHLYNWDAWAARTLPVPMVIGHEYSGQDVKLGRAVAVQYPHLQCGQRVSGEGHIIQHRSRNSRAGRFHLDPDTQGIGVTIPGAFAQYLALPAFNVIPLPPGISDELGAILDPLGNAVHAALSFDLVGEDVLITGAGPIGIMAAAIARFVGARHILITDINPYRLQLAQQCVADLHCLNSLEGSVAEAMAGLSMQEGFDVALEMSGVETAINQAFSALSMGGKLAALGLPSGSATLDWPSIVLKAIQIKGIYGREMFETWYKMLAMLESGLNIDNIITHRFAYTQFDQAFALINQGQAGKVILDWQD